MIKKAYYGNESFGLVRCRIAVRQTNLFIITHLVELNGAEFHGKPILIKEVRTQPPQSLKFEPRLRNHKIYHLQKNYRRTLHLYRWSKTPTAIIQMLLNQERKISCFSVNRGRRLHLKPFPGLKAVQLNHHIKPTLQEYTFEAAIIHVGINDIPRCKKQWRIEELPYNIIKIAHTCQKYNIGKMFISSIVTCTRTFANIAKLMKA